MTTEEHLYELLSELPEADQRSFNCIVAKILAGLVEHQRDMHKIIVGSVKDLLQAALRIEK